MKDENFSYIFTLDDDQMMQCLENFAKDEVFRYVKEYYKFSEKDAPASAPSQPAAADQPQAEDNKENAATEEEKKEDEAAADDWISAW